MGRRITLSLSPLPGRARLFFRRMYFSVCPVVLPIGLAERPHSPNLTTNHVLCVLRAVRNICGKPQHFLVLMTSWCVIVPSFLERSSSGASSRSKYLKEPRHIPEAIRETFDRARQVLDGSMRFQRDNFPAIHSSGTGLPGPGLPLRLPYQCTSSTAFSRVDRNVNQRSLKRETSG